MDLYLFQNEEQVGPYTKEKINSMIASGEITRDDFAWHEGLSDWQPIHTIISVDSPASPPKAQSTAPQEPTQHNEINTNVKQGAIIGGWVCFGLGTLCMLWALFLFFLYGPFLLAAFILSIVAMSQRRVLSGVALLIATLLIPSILALYLVTTRTADFADDFSRSLEEASTLENTTPSGDSEQTDTESEFISDRTASTTEESAPLEQRSKNPALDAKMGFREYRLGTPLQSFDRDNLKAAEAFIKSDTDYYFVDNFDPKLGAAEIENIQLGFNEGLLERVIVRVKGEQNGIALKETLIAGYGQPDKSSSFMTDSLSWSGDDCTSTLSFEMMGDANARFTSKSIDQKIKEIKLQKARDGAAAGIDSL
jgi:hypothetical protein